MNVWLAGIALAVGSQVPAPRTGAGIAAELRAERATILQDESHRLTDLADRREREGHSDQARAIREAIEPADSPAGPFRFVPLPEVAAQPSQSPPEEIAAIRAESARALFELARRASSPGSERFGVAAECLRGVLARDPDHREARRLLGFVAYEGGWATPEAAANLKAGKVLDSVFGWVPADWVPHLKQGELPGIESGGRAAPWLPAAEADALRRDFDRRPWKITTAHFAISTDVPLAEAIAFGRRLEALREAFLTYFADVFDPKELPLAQRIGNPSLWASPDAKRMQVWYFASQAEYVENLLRRFHIDDPVSLGYYMPRSEAARFRQPTRSYFFRDPDNPIDANSTLFHEGSHQVLFETGSSSYAANVGQFWVWEGLGTYFETFRPQPDGSYQLGGLVGPRIALARQEIGERGGGLPVSELIAMGKTRFSNRDDEVSLRYAEAMALAVFLIHGEDGRYRDGFLDYIADAYRGRFRAGGAGRPLPERLDVPAATLDEQFRRYLR
jgi:hypothetical protein